MADRNALERLSKKLDSGKGQNEIHRGTLPSRAPSAPDLWHDMKETAPVPVMAKRKPRFTQLELLFAGAVVFFIVAVILSFFLFFFGNNTVSTKNVDIQVSGPTEIGGGNTLSLQVVITNRNAVPMQLTDLVVEFPAGTRSAADITSALPRERDSLGTINPGESVSRTVNAVLFGAADTEAELKVSAEYRVPSSNAVFVSATTYSTRISQSPASISVTNLKQAVSGQAASFTVAVTSNSPQVLKNMLLIVTYPPGFSLTSATPAPASGTSVWNLGDIEPAGVRTVVMNGVFTGEDGDTRVLNFVAGNQTLDNPTGIAAPLASGEADVTVTKPFISGAISLNGSIADQHTISRGATVSGSIEWSNNLPVAVQDLSFELKLGGQVLDTGSIRANEGFYRSNTSSIVWDKSTQTTLAEVAPGQSGSFSFSFAALPQTQGLFKNPEIDLSLSLTASREGEGNVPESVVSTAATKALVATDLALFSSLSRGGPFANIGPTPPKVDTESTYTVTWTATNSANALANTAVTATLPNYARFVGTISPASENIAYDAKQSVVTWTVGDLAANQSKSVSFQVGITPSLSQKNQSPTVISAQRISGFDRFVQDNVESTADALTTASAQDAQGGGLVVP